MEKCSFYFFLNLHLQLPKHTCCDYFCFKAPSSKGMLVCARAFAMRVHVFKVWVGHDEYVLLLARVYNSDLQSVDTRA